MNTMRKKEKNNIDYQEVMKQIEILLSKATSIGGFNKLSADERETLRRLSNEAEKYEDNIPMLPLKQPSSLEEMLRYKMVEKGWRQKQMAAALEISEAAISGILSGKRKLTLELAKKLHLQLGIDAQFLLKFG